VRPLEDEPITIPFGAGRIGIGHRPSRKLVEVLRRAGFSHVVTLLSEREGASSVRDLVKAQRMEWLWFPVSSGKVPMSSDDFEMLLVFLRTVGALLASTTSSKLYLHCSAGVHRTGMCAFALFRWMGCPQNDALARLREARPITAQDVGESRLSWIDRQITAHLTVTGPEDAIRLP
jgi:protein-tyrosine phosphatase